jgi:hypothetical protein
VATFVQIEPDAFNKPFNNLVEDRKSGDFLDPVSETRVGNYHHVRRPVRGIQVKDDTYGTLQVRRADGVALPLFDAASRSANGRGTHNSNFLIQQVTEQRAEKMQVILTFGAPYFYFFGEQPRVISVSGVLLNTEDFNWRGEWWENYETYLRGSQCVRNKTRVYLSWDDIVVEGYISSANAVEGADNRNLVQFQFQMYLTNYQNISRIGDPDAHWIGKELNLDPSTVDLPGSGGTSKTVLVRQANQQAFELAQGRDKNSLFESLRSGQVDQLAGQFVEIQGQVVSFLALAGTFISGRNIRVPRGFEGAAAFDQEVQVALASIGADQIINGSSGERTVRLRATGNTGLVTDFVASLGARFLPAKTGLPIYLNHDEFVARQVGDATGAEKFNNLHGSQLAEDTAAGELVRDVFEDYGIEVDPPDELTRLFRKGMFGIVSVAAGLEVQNFDSLGSVVNQAGLLL